MSRNKFINIRTAMFTPKEGDLMDEIHLEIDIPKNSSVLKLKVNPNQKGIHLRLITLENTIDDKKEPEMETVTYILVKAYFPFIYHTGLIFITESSHYIVFEDHTKRKLKDGK